MLDVETTDDHFLGGRILIRQPRKGHRAGHDAILLAASTAAKPRQRVVDLGAGVGVAGLALGARVQGLDLTMVEIDPLIAALAAHNANVNGIDVEIVAADVADLSDALRNDYFDAVMMNPPFHDAARHRGSPDPGRRRAHLASEDAIGVWISAAYSLLKSGGTLTMIWRADGLVDVLATVCARFGNAELQLVHATDNKPAIRLLVRAVKESRAPLIIHRGICLDDEKIEAVMRGTGALALALR